MAILISDKTNVLVQGITGKEGLKAAIAMRDYGTTVLAGVTPGKGGQTVEQFPVFNTVKEAKERFPEMNTSVLYVPAFAVFDAALEAIEAGIPLINIITEHVPVRDTAILYATARDRKVQIIGPNSIGVIAPSYGKIGSIGGFTPERSYSKGPIGIISKSGGMCSEISHMLTSHGIGQSTVVGIGGDRIVGTTFADLLPAFEEDSQTKAVILYGEIGGTYEQEAAELVRTKKFTKPLIACVSGQFAETLPQGLHLGHAGAIIEQFGGTRAAKVEALRSAGAHVIESSDSLVEVCASFITSS